MRENQKNSTQLRPVLAGLLAMLFLLMINAVPFLHNHEPDLHDHADCPAFILSIQLQADDDFDPTDLFQIFLPDETCSVCFPVQIPVSVVSFQFYRRGPPVL